MSIPTSDLPDDVLTVNALKLLRRRAEDNPKMRAVLPAQLVNEMTPDDAQLLFHELRVHQVELELQNEELRRAQLELELARQRYFDLYDLAPVGYCSVTEQGLIIEANLTAAALLGVSRQELVNRSLTRFMAPNHRQVYRECCRQLLSGGEAQSCELQVSRVVGGTVWLSLAVNMTKDATDTTLLRVMFKDVTERKLLDAVLLQTSHDLELARQAADKANQAKSDFLADMSHELRSPLNAILGFAQLLDAGTPAPTPAQKSSIDQIIHGGWHLLGLVNEILDLASIESGQMALTMAAESLGEVLQECQALIAPLALANHIRLEFPSFGEPCWVQADRHRLKQLLINLLSNAIKYNRTDGSVVVRWQLRPQQRVRVSLEDSGQGLTPAQIAQLFQPFNRLGQESGQQQGTGIGLVVSKRLAEMMGGSIGVSSTPGVGSVFWFELALNDASA